MDKALAIEENGAEFLVALGRAAGVAGLYEWRPGWARDGSILNARRANLVTNRP